MRITGTGSAVPAREVTNDELATFLDTSDEWISTRTGIRTRRVLSSESLDALALTACERALESAGLAAADIDFIICSTVQGEWITPGMACVMQQRLGATCPCVDINGACAGFIYALDIADSYIATGRARNVLVLCAEAMSRITDWADRSSCVLFGDGAAAAVVSEGEGFMKLRLTTHGNPDVLYAPASHGSSPYAQGEEPPQGIRMQGQEVYKAAVTYSSEDLRAIMDECGVETGDVSCFILHQANLRIIEAIRHRLKAAPAQVPHNIERTGNTSSAACAILLDEQRRSGALHRGDIVALSAFGAGFVTGAALLRWTMD